MIHTALHVSHNKNQTQEYKALPYEERFPQHQENSHIKIQQDVLLKQHNLEKEKKKGENSGRY